MSSRVLVATDGSELSRKTSAFVVRMSKSVPLEIDLAQVVDMHLVEYRALNPMYVDMIREGAKATAETILARESSLYAAAGLTVKPRVLFGRPGEALCQTAAGEGFPLLVMGRKGERGDVADLLFGSVSHHVVHNCRRPVLVVKGASGPIATGAEARRPLRLLVPVDGSLGGQRCVDFVRASGWEKGVEVALVNVVDVGTPELERLPAEHRNAVLEALHKEAQQLLDRNAALLREAGFTVTTRVEEGSPGKTVCAIYQEDAFEIAVIGRHGVGSMEDTVMGAVPNYVLHHCPGHVLIVP